ncbi:HalD/BesD family halogenase [Candidatus Spongiihabitans sp.]|uniref:HalD/BesD family halogenase n=1 Tax=Candidatus Spongiihabitans sp. TaxID=3101308 RepID=UPI003C6F1CBC
MTIIANLQTTAAGFDGKNLINYGRYPIANAGHSVRQKIIEKVKSDLADDGCALLDGFLNEFGLGIILNEALERRSTAYFSNNNRTNAYFSTPDPSLPNTHPVNIMMDRTNGFITSDQFEPTTNACQFYHWHPLLRFLADCLDKDQLYIYADPISNMIINVCSPGTQFNWHFDTNEFTITMLLKPASSGGYFEYAPAIRTADDENYTGVAEVLKGKSDRVKRLQLKPGDLQFFLGRYALHQVTKNTGDDDRLLIIMSFTEQPDVVGSKQRVKQLYGRLAKAHHQDRSRNDNLMD